MIPVYQTKFSNINGNCFSSCIASILEIPLETVPNFCTLDIDDWYNAFLWWCSTIGYSYIELNYSYKKMSDGQLCILTGKSPRGNFLHCVVGMFEDEKIIVIHDPHPDRGGIDGEPEQYGVFIPILIRRSK